VASRVARNTYGGNPICCAAALATLDLVESRYMANAAEVGATFLARLRELQMRHPEIGDVRGKGLFLGVEMVKDRASKQVAAAFCEAAITRAFHNGLLLLSCGTSTIRLIPPLLVSHAEVEEAVAILEASLNEAREQVGAVEKLRFCETLRFFGR
jgi:4-aminobutyrate aminotransferase